MSAVNLPKPCPYCGYLANAATGLGTAQLLSPTDDDVSICLACGAVSLFALGGAALRKPTPEERAEILTDTEVSRVIGVVLTAKALDDTWPVGPDSPKGQT